MVKMIYEKPTVEYVVFYAEEELTSELPIQSVDYYAQETDTRSGNQIFSTVVGEGEGDDDWGD